MWSTFSLISKIKKNDLVILFSPLIIYAPFLFLNKSVKICLYFDFFPIHQIQLKVITKFKKILYLIERYLFNKKMYAVGLMSPKNIEFAKKYFNPNKTILFKAPLWSFKKPEAITSKKFNKKSTIKVFFGGQLINGRNIPFMISFIKHIIYKFKNYEFHIFGSGKYELDFKKLSIKHKKIIFHGKKSHKEYFNKIQEFDIGLAFTNLNTSIPSYPSKSLDMLLSGIPILGVSEKSSDFSAIINSSKSGEIINTNDIKMLCKKLELIRNNYSIYSNNAIKFYNKSHFYSKSLKKLKNIIHEIK